MAWKSTCLKDQWTCSNTSIVITEIIEQYSVHGGLVEYQSDAMSYLDSLK
jgi:hypothetical protein